MRRNYGDWNQEQESPRIIAKPTPILAETDGKDVDIDHHIDHQLVRQVSNSEIESESKSESDSEKEDEPKIQNISKNQESQSSFQIFLGRD